MKALYRNTTLMAVFLAALFITSITPVKVEAADLTVSGWIPYWASAKGIKEASKNLSKLDEINPFAYSVKSDGSLADTAKLTSSSWKKLFRDAEKKDVAVIPTVMWSDRANIERILMSPSLRARHVEHVARMAEDGDFDGVDIDYENKSAATRPYFSLFLKELDAALGDKELSCTIEARTPPDSVYRTVPATIEYANDFKEINKYCDQVRMMAYDQQTADWKLNDANPKPYAPLSDKAWVKKVMELAAKDIDRDKLVMGVPTYGHEYAITVHPSGYMEYKKLWSLNPVYAKDTAKKMKATAARAAHGEMRLAYIPKDSAAYKTKAKVDRGVSKAELPIEQAKAHAKATGKPAVVNVMWWHDAGAIEEKVELAESLGIKGVAIFKIDGGADSKMWKVLP
ncbi:MAG TPA: glycosyl hydrolase family 18 protein [Candidatus Paceibacterota bacterium]|nr:glycosyl hydrolase family 18 protein [Candidatus Paceibacterota bacterium]